MARPKKVRCVPGLPALLGLSVILPAAITLACEKVTEDATIQARIKYGSFGTAAAVQGGVALIGAPRDAETGTVHAWFIDPQGRWRPETVLQPESASAGSAVGSALAFEAGMLLIGAPADSFAGVDAGTVHVYERSMEGAWSSAGRLEPGTGLTGARFGQTLDMNGDLAVVASPGTGAAHVFRRNGSAWAEETVLFSNVAGPGNAPAVCVAIHGQTVLVGDPLGDSDRQNAGEVHVYHASPAAPGPDSGMSWDLDSVLVAGDGHPAARFGAALSIHNDYAVIGAPGASQIGAAYVFRYDDLSDTWSEVARLQASDLKPGDRFGASVTIHNDAIAIGAPQAGHAGRVYLYRSLGAEWVLQKTMIASVAGQKDGLGSTVTTDGSTILATAPGRVGTGTAYTLTMPPLGDCDANGIPDTCDIALGSLPDGDGDGVPDNCGLLTCAAADINGDGIVDFDDMIRVILDWCTDGSDNDGDVDDDGFVGVDDLNTILGFWGECPGGCCLPVTISCVELTISECEAQGGQFVGTTLGCDDFGCPPQSSPPEACCLPEGGCLLLSPELCDIIEGTAQGEGTTCGDLVCPG